MTLVKHELKQGKISFLIWTASIGFLLAICIFLFPEMKGQMDSVNDMFASMGSFTEAFGMDRLNFGTLIGFYAVECGNVLGLGGAFFAALCAVGILSKEEKDKTAEFLLTHPVSRKRIITEKLIAVLLQITAMNLIIYALSLIHILPCCIIAGKYGPQSLGAGAGNGIFTAGAIADGAGLTVGPHVAPGTLQNLVIGHRKSLQLV